MTVTSATARASYAGNGVTTAFTVPFRFLENSHVRVTLIDEDGVEADKTLTTHYTVAGAGDATGTVTMLTAPLTGETLLVRRNVPLTQETNYVNGDRFPADSHENALDKLTMVSQQLEDRLDDAEDTIDELVTETALSGYHDILEETFADRASNPYGTTYPSWMYGIGGSSYYDIKPLGNSTIFSKRGAVNFANQFPYGGLDQPMGATFSVGAPARPGGVAGFTAASQSAAYDEFGMSALLTQADTRPLMLRVAGTFTATTFVPTTPFALVTTAGSEITLKVGMWIRTSDAQAFNGQITGWEVNGSGEVTSITVSNWYKRGAGGVAGTPSGTRAIINPLDKVWTQLSTTFLNKVTFTGTCTNGSATVTAVSSTTGLVPNGTLCYGVDGSSNVVVAHGTVITGINSAGTEVYLSANSSYSGTVTFTASLGTEVNKAVAAEVDMHNAGPNFVPVWIQDTGDITSGSYTVSNLAQVALWRAGLFIYGTGPTLNYVVSVDYTANSLVLKYPATATTVGVALKGQNQFDEAGTGWDMLAANNYSNIGYLARGSWTYGFYSMGGLEDGFICRPDFLAGLPKYGFRVDGRVNGQPSVAAFAVTSNTYEYWAVRGTGDTFQRGNINFFPPASATPANNGEATFQYVSDTQLQIKMKGADGVVRSVTLTLA